MDVTAVLREVERWPVEDRIRLVEEVWDRLVDQGHEPELTDEFKAELDRRLAFTGPIHRLPSPGSRSRLRPWLDSAGEPVHSFDPRGPGRVRCGNRPVRGSEVRARRDLRHQDSRGSRSDRCRSAAPCPVSRRTQGLVPKPVRDPLPGDPGAVVVVSVFQTSRNPPESRPDHLVRLAGRTGDSRIGLLRPGVKKRIESGRGLAFRSGGTILVFASGH